MLNDGDLETNNKALFKVIYVGLFLYSKKEG